MIEILQGYKSWQFTTNGVDISWKIANSGGAGQ